MFDIIFIQVKVIFRQYEKISRPILIQKTQFHIKYTYFPLLWKVKDAGV